MAGDSVFLESSTTLGGLDSGTSENRVSLVLFGGETDLAIVGPEATPANDGVPNLLKYAFGFDAMTPVSAADLPQPEAENGVLRLTFLERRNASDVTYTPERSLDLNGVWDENVTEVSRVPEGDFNRVTVEADVPDGTTEAFLRVNVTEN